MRAELQATAQAEHVVFQWLFQCGCHAFTNGDELTLGSTTYSSIVTKFDGIDMARIDPVAGTFPAWKTSFATFGGKLDYDPDVIEGESVTVSLYANSAIVGSWGYEVKRLTYAYGIWTWALVDFLSRHLKKDWPLHPLVSSLETSTPRYGYAGDKKACVPEIFGRVKLPVRDAYVSDRRYAILGPTGDTYTVHGAETPVEWDEHSEYDAAETAFTQSEQAGYQTVTGENGAAGPWARSSQIYDPVIDFEKASTSALTNPADTMSAILQHYIAAAKIGTTGTWATAKATYGLISGLALDVGFPARSTLRKTLCSLLVACNSTIRYTDTVDLVYLDDVVQRTLNRSDIKDLNYSPIENDTQYDGTTVGYWPDVQGGEPTTIAVAVDGTTPSSLDGSVLEIIGLTDTELVQKIGIRHAREDRLKIGTVSFTDLSGLHMEPGDKISIVGDDLYQDFSHCYIERVKIISDLAVSITASVYSEALGDLDDFSPVSVVPDEDDAAYNRPLSERWLRTLFIRSATLPDLPTDVDPSGWSESDSGGAGTLYYIQAWFWADQFWPDCTWMSVIRAEGQDGVDGVNGADGVDGADGINGVSVVWQGDLPSHPASPENGWAYYNTTEGKSFIYQDSTWYQMTIDGQDGVDGANGADGLSVVWMGESASPPADPEINWVYKDTDNGITYIYSGTAWEVMVNDGVDGAAGADGSDGLSIEVQYSTDGSSWHDDYAAGDVYLRQRVGESGTWSSAIKFVGDDGADGVDGADGAAGDTGPGLVPRGESDDPGTDGVQYYATAIRRDAVLVGGVWYACKQSCMDIPVTNTVYWEAMPGYSSVSTALLLADDATILRTLIIGWSDATGHLYDCAIRSGMSDSNTGYGYFLGRESGNSVVSFRVASNQWLRLDESAGTAQYSGSLTLTGGSGIGNFSDASLANIDSAADTKLGGISAGADVTQTIINGGLITTGWIGNAVSNPILALDFVNGEIEVGGANGLIINSGSGVTIKSGSGLFVEGGADVTIEDGGDIVFECASTPSELIFKSYSYVGSPYISECALWSTHGELNLSPTANSDTASMLLKIGSTTLPWYSVDLESVFVNFKTTKTTIEASQQITLRSNGDLNRVLIAAGKAGTLPDEGNISMEAVDNVTIDADGAVIINATDGIKFEMPYNSYPALANGQGCFYFGTDGKPRIACRNYSGGLKVGLWNGT